MAKVPPPPFMTKTKDNQTLNRWLLELTSILNSAGDVDPGSVAGLAALVIQVTAQAAQITALQTLTTTQAGQITALQTLTATHTGQIAALQARNQVLNGAGVPGAGLGNNGDWYLNTVGVAGSKLYLKLGGVWTAYI